MKTATKDHWEQQRTETKTEIQKVRSDATPATAPATP
jgi:hypothetical protein